MNQNYMVSSKSVHSSEKYPDKLYPSMYKFVLRMVLLANARIKCKFWSFTAAGQLSDTNAYQIDKI